MSWLITKTFITGTCPCVPLAKQVLPVKLSYGLWTIGPKVYLTLWRNEGAVLAEQTGERMKIVFKILATQSTE